MYLVINTASYLAPFSVLKVDGHILPYSLTVKFQQNMWESQRLKIWNDRVIWNDFYVNLIPVHTVALLNNKNAFCAFWSNLSLPKLFRLPGNSAFMIYYGTISLQFSFAENSRVLSFSHAGFPHYRAFKCCIFSGLTLWRKEKMKGKKTLRSGSWPRKQHFIETPM